MKKNKNLSAAAQERRKEEQRKQDRKRDVVIGKTSAVPNAKDYPVDPSSTQELFLRQASAVERVVFEETERGMEALKMLKLKEIKHYTLGTILVVIVLFGTLELSTRLISWFTGKGFYLSLHEYDPYDRQIESRT